MIWTLAVAGVVAVVLAILGLNTLRGFSGHALDRLTPEAASKLLAPAYRIAQPLGEGPFPMLLLFSGCDGPQDNMDRWAAMARGEGWATMIVDSHGPRGFDDWQLWRLICAGQLLTGQERAGDVAVALDDARALPFVDPDRIVLLGASHGGWSVLDLLSLHGTDTVPPSLTGWPDSLVARGLRGVRGAIVLYPYCGLLSRARREGWQHDAPVHFLLAHRDGVTDEEKCIELARTMEAAGRDVTVRVYGGVTHGFDQQIRNSLSPLEFSADATKAALQEGRTILKRLAT